MPRFLTTVLLALAATGVAAEEGMWRLDQVPTDTIASKYGIQLTSSDLERLRQSAVRILSSASGGTGTLASRTGLVLTNHHVALDCIRTSTLAEQNKGRADNLIEEGFTAASMADELPCKRFRIQIERSARDVTTELSAALKPDMDIAAIQQARQQRRSDLERACQRERGDRFSCVVEDFNSGARSLLVVYEDFNDVRLVYAPEQQLGYFGGDEMNFRFPRYVSDISILRVYVGKDGSHGEYDPAHVPYRPEQYLRVTLAGVEEGDFTFVAGFPGNTNRYRMSFSADYNLETGFPERIRDYEAELGLLRKYAATKPDYEVLLQGRILSLSNRLKYERDVLAALRATDIVTKWRARERAFLEFLRTKPDLQQEYGSVLDAQRAVYAEDVEANAELDAALQWIQKSSVVSYAVALYEFATERDKPSDREREPQFQERRWPDVRRALLDDEPIIAGLEEELLTLGLQKALALDPAQRIPAVTKLVERVGSSDARRLAQAVLSESTVAAADTRKALIDSPPAAFEKSTDPALVFAVELEPSLRDLRRRVRVLNEKLFQNRARFARGLVAWKQEALYPDANFTLRGTYGRAAGYVDQEGRPVPFTTRLEGLFALANARGNTGEFALPPRLRAWRDGLDEEIFQRRYADLPVNFVSTNDITGGNSGSATLNRDLQIVGLIFDGNQEAMGSDWIYSETAGRAISTDIRFALTVAREVHGGGWVVDELLHD